jgi:LmbE family N-acetylglucosaminyl deacetylase
LMDYDVRRFKEFRQNILEDLIRLRSEINPDLVFLPASQDIHQDHQAISEEGFRAFKNASVLGYELPWNNTSFNTDTIMEITEMNLNTKIEALKAYQSQRHRNYFNEDFIRGLAKVRGVQSGKQLAEAFETFRWFL